MIKNAIRFFAILLCVSSIPSFAQTTRYIYSCGILNQYATTYVLQNNVSSAGTCFSIQNNKITLDLNGKTVGYGSNGSTTLQRRYGVLGIKCWDNPAVVGDNPCNGYFDDLTIKNGSIVQLPGAYPYSHGIRLGQGGGKRLKTENVNITVSSTASLPIHVTYQYGTDISGGTITNNVTKINYRTQIEGLSVRLSEGSLGTSPDYVHNLKIVGGPQGGILLTVPGSVAHDNDISLAGTYTNDFGIYLWTPRAEARSNYLHGQMRGIQVNNDYNKVTSNTISVYEANKNVEYGGCEISGSFGIQFEKKSRYGVAAQNAVTVLADQCDARAMRWTETQPGNGNLSQANYYKAVRAGTTIKVAAAASFSAMSGAVSEHDTFEADTFNAEIPWDGGNNILLKNSTFKKGTNPASNYFTFVFNGGSSAWSSTTRKDTMTVQDGTFLNGASKDSVRMYPIGYAGWAVPAMFTMQWTYRLKVVNSTGAAVSGASVTITDNKGAVISATTDSYGWIPPTVLKEYVKYNTTSSVIRDTRSYTVKITKGTSCSKSVPMTITGVKTVTETLTCA